MTSTKTTKTTQTDEASVTPITAAKGGRKPRQSRASRSAAQNAPKPPASDEPQGETLTDDERAQLAAHTDELRASASDDAGKDDEPKADPEPAPAPVLPEDEIPADQLVVLLTSDGFEVHKHGCRDIKRARKAGTIQNVFGLAGTWTSPRAIAAELYSDQIAEAGIDLDADADADISSYEAETNVRPCTGLTGRAARASTTTRTLDADAAAARAELLAERSAAADKATGKLAIPAGYVIHWAYPAGHSRLARTSDAPEGAAKWLARCDEHGTTKPAAGAKEARSLGARSQRVSWCKPCKIAADKKAAAAAKADSTSASTSDATTSAPATSDASTSDATSTSDDAGKGDDTTS
jgi:hypothetical protein